MAVVVLPSAGSLVGSRATRRFLPNWIESNTTVDSFSAVGFPFCGTESSNVGQ